MTFSSAAGELQRPCILVEMNKGKNVLGGAEVSFLSLPITLLHKERLELETGICLLIPCIISLILLIAVVFHTRQILDRCLFGCYPKSN